jgi:hypothetical protein
MKNYKHGFVMNMKVVVGIVQVIVTKVVSLVMVVMGVAKNAT